MRTNPKNLRDRAEEIRTLADKINDPTAKAQMIGVADGYERLAEQAEERLRRVEKRTWR